MKSSYTLLLACLAISSLVYAKSEEHLVRSENADHKKSKSHKENSSKAKHYLYPRSSRPKKHASGVTLSGLSVKGNVLVPISKDTLKEAHNCMMHVYEHTFHAKHGHVLEVMQTIVESKSKKEFAAFKKAIARIHESSDDWNALKQASASYDLVALTYVEFCEKERLQEKKCELNSRLEKVLRKIAHTQPALVYASGKLAHSRLLLQEYAQDCILDQYVKNAEESCKNSNVKMKFNTSQPCMVQARDRLVALCLLLEGAVVNYCAVKEAFVPDHEKEALLHKKVIHAIVKEIKKTFLI